MLVHGGGIAKLKDWNLGMGVLHRGVTRLNNSVGLNVLMVIVY